MSKFRSDELLKKEAYENYNNIYGENNDIIFKIFKQVCYDNMMPFDVNNKMNIFCNFISKYSSHQENHINKYINEELNKIREEKLNENFESNEYLDDN